MRTLEKMAPVIAFRLGLALVLTCAACESDDAEPFVAANGGGGAASGADASAGAGGDSTLPLPDLVLDAAYLADTTALDVVVVEDECLLASGCVTGLGERRVVRFGSRTGNVGRADVMLGAAREGNPFGTFNACRESFDLVGFARYALIERATNETVVVGAKSGFCIADAERYADDFGLCNVYDCEQQGISQGCADNYGSELECQWVDVTDVAPGSYELTVTINADRNIEEIGYENNVVRLRIELGEDEVAVELLL